MAVSAFVAGCADSSPPAALVQSTVVNGPVYDGRVCAYRIDAAGAIAADASDCERLDGNGGTTLAVPASASFLLVASGVLYRDESAGGAAAALDGVLESVVTTAAAGSSQQVAITPLTGIAVATLRERGTALSGSAYESMLDRVAGALGLSAAQVRVIPAFDAGGTPLDSAAAAIASISDLGRTQGTGLSAQIALFARMFSKLYPDAELASYNQQMRAALAARLGVDATTLPTIYGYGGTSGPAATVDANQRCFAKAYGIWVDSITFHPNAASFSLCISQAPAGGSCDAAFLHTLDFSGITIHGANNSAEIVLRAALGAFTTDTDRYRLEFAASCDSYPTLDATLSRGKLYYPGFLAPMQ